MSIQQHILYLSAADSVRGFSNFRVEETSIATTTGSVQMFMVTAQRGGVGRPELMAEFPLELHAQIFCDLCDSYARHNPEDPTGQ